MRSDPALHGGAGRHGPAGPTRQPTSPAHTVSVRPSPQHTQGIEPWAAQVAPATIRSRLPTLFHRRPLRFLAPDRHAKHTNQTSSTHRSDAVHMRRKGLAELVHIRDKAPAPIRPLPAPVPPPPAHSRTCRPCSRPQPTRSRLLRPELADRALPGRPEAAPPGRAAALTPWTSPPPPAVRRLAPAAHSSPLPRATAVSLPRPRKVVATH